MTRQDAIRLVLDAWDTLDEQFAWRHYEGHDSSPKACRMVLTYLGVDDDEIANAERKRKAGA